MCHPQPTVCDISPVTTCMLVVKFIPPPYKTTVPRRLTLLSHYTSFTKAISKMYMKMPVYMRTEAFCELSETLGVVKADTKQSFANLPHHSLQ